MRLLFLTLFFSFSFSFGYAQKKILFDATKAETANNADWVIDADQFNMGWGPTAYIGGHEANAQRIPSPAQEGITGSTSQNYWKGALSAWGVDAVQAGYYVESLPYDGSITYGNSANSQDLSNYAIYVVCEPNILFTDAEKTAILNFVRNGGGLFMISDHHNSDRNGDGKDSPDVWNDLLQNNAVQTNPFGIIFDYEYFSDGTNNIPDLPNDPILHGAYGDVSRVEFYGGTSMTLSPSANANVKAVVFRSGYSDTGVNGVLCAYSTFGDGKVVALGDSSPADDGSGDNGDNLYDGWIQDANGNHERLIMNATLWLTNTTLAATSLDKQENVKISGAANSLQLNIQSQESEEHFQLEVFDLMGRLLLKQNNLHTNQNYQFDFPQSGAFLYRLSNQSSIVAKGKFFKS
jgi:hypothetical protein